MDLAIDPTLRVTTRPMRSARVTENPSTKEVSPTMTNHPFVTYGDRPQADPG